MHNTRLPGHSGGGTQRYRRLAARAPIAAALAAALLLSGCSAGPSPDAAGNGSDPVGGGTLTFGRSASVTSLDLHRQISANNAFAIDKIFEPLISFDKTGKLIPWLADYTVDDAALVYTFTLRKGLQFSSGAEVTPADVVFSLNHHREVGGPLPLEAPIASIEATGVREVTITLSGAYTPFLSELSGFSNGIFPANFGGETEETFFQQPVGTGPFAVDKWDPNGDISFVKNEHYWQEGKPYLDRLVYSFIADDTQLRQQLAAGQIDAIDTVPSANAAAIDDDAGTTLATTDSWSTAQIVFNTQREQFADERVRRAIAHAIDREGITTATTFGTAEVANSLLPPTIPYSATNEGYALDYDLAAAKKELAKSAYPDGFTTTLLTVSGDSQRAQIAQIVQEALGKIGITVTIEQLDAAAFRERFFAYDYDFKISSGQSDAPDPNGFISFQADPEGFSKSYWTHFTDDRVTELMKQGRVTPDGAERKAIYFEIQKILAEKVPYIPLFFPSNLKATTEQVQGFYVLPNGSVRFEDAWLKPRG
jgi:peptide/nickel transport system substrate-binding protein